MTLLAASSDKDLHRPLLWRRDKASTNEWHSLKIEFDVRRRNKAPARKKFWLGYNGERWAENHDAAYLAAHHPAVLTWAEASLQDLP